MDDNPNIIKAAPALTLAERAMLGKGLCAQGWRIVDLAYDQDAGVHTLEIDGEPDGPVVVQGSTYRELDQNAHRTIKRLRQEAAAAGQPSPPATPAQITIVIDADGEMIVLAPSGTTVEVLDYQWGAYDDAAQESYGHEPTGGFERDPRDDAPLVRYTPHTAPDWISSCGECERPVAWNEALGDYQHIQPGAPACALALAGPTPTT